MLDNCLQIEKLLVEIACFIALLQAISAKQLVLAHWSLPVYVLEKKERREPHTVRQLSALYTVTPFHQLTTRKIFLLQSSFLTPSDVSDVSSPWEGKHPLPIYVVQGLKK